MEEKKNCHFTGERALFKAHNISIIDCLFNDGESPLKEARNLIIRNCTFGWKYPLWYGKGHDVSNSKFETMSRSGIWYTDDSTFHNLDIDAPKLFRRCKNIEIADCDFHDAKETLWTCENVEISNVKIENGDYFGKDSSDIVIDNMHLNGNYCFDGGKNIKVRNSVLNSKDAFWNTENVEIENSTIIGEYFGWNSKNITIRNSTIESHQGFCYIDKLTIKETTLHNSDLIFEYCTDSCVEVDGDFTCKNPTSGRYVFLTKNELILTEESDGKLEIINGVKR